MVRIKILKCTAIALLCSSNFSYAWDFSFSIGRTGQTQNTFRISALKHWESRWLESSVGHVSGFWDLGFTHWDTGSYHKKNNNLSFSPVFTYEFNTSNKIKPFIEAGIGAAAFSKTYVGNKRLGGSLNFEDRLGIGFMYGKHRFGFRVMHYSNAGIRKPNEGIESYSIYYAHSF